MEYNKFIYKLNKYKSYLRDSKKKRKDHYQQKIDFYYNKINEIINNIDKQNGGAFTEKNLIEFLKPTTQQINEILDKKANIEVFQREQEKYKENHKKIIIFLNSLLESTDLLNTLNSEADSKLQTITKQLADINEQHRKEIQEKLNKIKEKVDTRKKLSLENIKTQYKIK
jgi:hypothetical protein